MIDDREFDTKYVTQLTPRERDVIRLRYGLYDIPPAKLEDIAAIFGLTRERVRQIQWRAEGKLRRMSVEAKEYVDNHKMSCKPRKLQ